MGASCSLRRVRTRRRIHSLVLFTCTSLAAASARADGAAPRGLVLDASAGVPKLDRSTTKIVGSAVGGWEGGAWSAVARGSYAAYDFSGNGGVQQSERLDGGVDGAGRFKLTDGLRLELLGSLGGASYDTTTISPAQPLRDESSIIIRGSALAGLRLATGGHTAYALFGGGLQREDHSGTSVVFAGNGAAVGLEDETQTSLRLSSRLGARLSVMPDKLALRARIDANMSSLRRDKASILVTSGQSATVAQATGTEKQSLLELESRLFIDIDALAVSVLVPALFAGVDVVRASSSTASFSATVPVAGLGVFARLE